MVKIVSVDHTGHLVASHFRRVALAAMGDRPCLTQHGFKDFEALKKAAQQISDMLQQSGVSEDEIIADFQKARSHTAQP